MKIRDLLCVPLSFAVGCSDATSTEEKAGTDMPLFDQQYCFFSIDQFKKDRSLDNSNKALIVLRLIYKKYEDGELLLPPLSSEGVIYYAEPCAQNIMNPELKSKEIVSQLSGSTVYKQVHDRATATFYKYD